MQNDVKTKRSQKKKLLPFEERVGFSPTEFAQLFGRQAIWGYRQIYGGKVKAIQELGRLIIPKSEIDRLLATAAPYNGEANAGGGGDEWKVLNGKRGLASRAPRNRQDFSQRLHVNHPPGTTGRSTPYGCLKIIGTTGSLEDLFALARYLHGMRMRARRKS